MFKAKIRDEFPIVADDLQEEDIHGGPETRSRNREIILGLLAGSTFSAAAALVGLSVERVRQIWMLTSLRQLHRRGSLMRNRQEEPRGLL